MSAAENEQLQTIVDTIKQRLPGAITSEETTYGDLVLIVDRRQCHDVLRQLREAGFDFLADIAGVDLLRLEHDDRFQLVYNLYSISMFGFNFEGHPNLVRILCHREFEGHALRKDYPVMKGQWAAGSSDLMQDIDKE
jgi:NADH:ubiquinone oxidoreductase subunit C